MAPTTPSPSRQRALSHGNYGSLSWKDLNVPFQACDWPRGETAPAFRVHGTSWTPNLPQYVLSHRFFGPNNHTAFHFCSFRIPRRTHPLRSLLRLPGTHRSTCTVPFPIQHGQQRSPLAANGVPPLTEHDMQGDAATVIAVDMEPHRGVLVEGPRAETQGRRGCSTRRSVSRYECEVLPSIHSSLAWD